MLVDVSALLRSLADKKLLELDGWLMPS